jgi:putative flippase GtrA
VRFCRFNLVGLMGASWQLLLIWALTKGLHVAASVATAIAVEIVVLHNFLWHERFTWPERMTKATGQRSIRLARFHAGNGLVSLIGNTILMYWLVERLKAPLPLSALVAILACSLVNFLIADRWVYRPRPYIRIRER